MLSILGSKEFITKIRNDFFRTIVHPEVPETKALAMETTAIIRAVSTYFSIPQSRLRIHQRAKDNTPRDIAMYLIRNETGKPLHEIGELFDMEKYSSVSSCILRINRRLKVDESLERSISEIQNQLKSQKQT